MNEKNIIWLASYPKSGNTWIRSILTSLINSHKGEFNFEYLKTISNFEQPFYYNFIKNINIKDYNKLNELKIISKYWVKAQKEFNKEGLIRIFKTHSANISFLNNEYTNQTTVKALVYIIRDPRDVVISYAKHLNKSIDETIDIAEKINALTFNSKQNYPSILSKWEYHVLSWVNLDVPKIIIKYEDLLINTYEVVLELINFFEIKVNFKFNKTKDIIKKIIQNTSFDKLKQYEQNQGFPEATNNSIFFRSGKHKQWKTKLTADQLIRINSSFKETMVKFGYL